MTGRDEARQALASSQWLLGDRAIRTLIELTVGLWVARHLGPEHFGQLSYALALVALVAPLTSLGLQGIVVRELVRHPEHTDEILGSGLAVRLVGGTASYLLLWAVSSLGLVSDPTRQTLTRIIAVGVLFQLFEVFEHWCQATVRIYLAAAARSAAAVVAGAVRAALILTIAPLSAFAWAAVLETVIWAAGLLGGYLLLGGSLQTLSVRRVRVGALLAQSWPLVLSGFGALLNLRVDQVMLGELGSRGELGDYSAAVRLSEALYMVPNIFAVAVFPAMIRAREQTADDYRQRMQRLWDFAVWLSLACSLPVSLLAPTVVPLVLGPAYAAAGPILSLHVWAFVFVFMGAVLSRWLVNEGLLYFSLVRHGLGAAVNVALNLALIPRFGGLGAAAATLASYAVASYLSCLLYRPTRVAAVMMTRALLMPRRALRAAGRKWRSE